MQKPVILLAAASGVLISILPGYAEDKNQTEFILPDAYFINQECNFLRIKTQDTPSLQKFS